MDQLRSTGRLVAGTVAFAAVLGALASGPAQALTAGAPLGAAPAAAAPLAASPTAGVQVGSGCTSAAGLATCDLYARAGTLAVAGTSVPVWNFTPGSADALTGTGPLLVVNQGDTVTVNLHNTLTVPIALAVPGMGGLPDDLVGAASGAAKSYTFTATRPGTYLYESGHTPLGARAAAMGLVGALVVRPTGFSPTAPSDLAGTTPVPFDDEAVLVLSDIDPAFNAAPLTYDLRSFHSAYRLINGKAFPETDPIPSAGGRSVLLRYVNAGMMQHSMGALGQRQKVVAIDARPVAGTPLVADMLAAGETEDALVALPPTFSGKTVVYDTSGALDNAGAFDGTTSTGSVAARTYQVAFGGMMTTITSDTVTSTTDTTGPSSIVRSVLPNPAKVTDSVVVTADVTDPTVPGQGAPSGIASAELLVDTQVTSIAPGSSAIQFTVPTGNPLTAPGLTATIPSAMLQTLAEGVHTVWVRARDAAGNWGTPGSATFRLAVTGPTTTLVTVTPTPTNGLADVTISARADDSALGGTITAITATLAGNPYVLTVTPPASTLANGSVVVPSAQINALAEGIYPVSVTSTDSLALVGPAATANLTVDKTPPVISSTPCLGAVSPNPFDGVRGDVIDPTSIKVTATFGDPLSGAVQSNITGAEGFLGAAGASLISAPAVTNGAGAAFLASDGAFNSPNEAAYGLISISTLSAYPSGTYAVWIHARDAAGNWGPLVAQQFRLVRGLLLADGFECRTAVQGPWTATTGATGLTLSTVSPLAGLQSLQVTAAGTGGRYVRQSLQGAGITPVTAVHARFQFNPYQSTVLRTSASNINNPTTYTAIFSTYGALEETARGAQVQYRRGLGAAAVSQVRLVAFTATSGTAVYGSWVNLPAGTTTVQIDWTAGTSQAITLRLNGTLVSTVTATTTALSPATGFRLGFTNAASTTVGVAKFDSFIASRNLLP